MIAVCISDSIPRTLSRYRVAETDRHHLHYMHEAEELDTYRVSGRGSAAVASDGGCCNECGHCVRHNIRTNGKPCKKGKKGNDGALRWCSFDGAKRHSDAELQKQREIQAVSSATAQATLAPSQQTNQTEFPKARSVHLAQLDQSLHT